MVECLPPLVGSSEYLCSAEGVWEGVEPICAERFCDFAEPMDSFYLSNCDSVQAGGFCVISCPAGYSQLETIFFCGPDWLLRGILPNCARIVCDVGTLPLSLGANYSGCEQKVPGATCEVSCRSGFEGESRVMSCEQSGAFVGEAVACARKPCDASFNSSVEINCRAGAVASSVTALHGDRCVASCGLGTTGQATELRCVNGEFLGSAPTCLPVQCTWQGFNLRSHVDSTSCLAKKLGESCQLACHEGYVASGDPLVLCQEDNFFSTPGLTCSPKSCGDLSTLPGFESTVVGHNCQSAVFSEICSSFCLDGYQSSGAAVEQLLCTADGGTSEGFAELDGRALVAPTCVAQPCTVGLPTQRGAAHNCSGVVTGEVCVVTAQPGYTALPSESSLLCQADGQLVGPTMALEPGRCGANFSEGVGSTCQDKVLGSECWAYCLRNYDGDPQRYFCTWTSEGAVAVAESLNISCAAAASAASGTSAEVASVRRLQAACGAEAVEAFGLTSPEFAHACENLVHDEVCLVHCNFGWEMTSSPSVLVCDSGTLQGTLPSCQALPCNFSWPGPETSHNCSGAVTLQSCGASCGDGFHGHAAPKICGASGDFVGDGPSCVAALCTAPVVPGAVHDCQDKRLGQSCTVQCAQGFVGGLSRLTCGSSGFIGTLPSCQALRCVNSVPSDPALNRSLCDGVLAGQNCSINCNSGYVANSSDLECTMDGVLQGILPICAPLTCDRTFLARAEYMDNCQDIRYGLSCNVFCSIGHEAADGLGLEELRCSLTETGAHLVGVLPRCVASACGEGLPLASQRSLDNCSGLSFAETCVERCAQGYEGGVASFSCGADGAALRSGDTECRPRVCEPNVIPELLQHTCVNVSFQGTCYAYCPAGYVGERMATRLDCLGPGNGLPAVGDGDGEEVTLRGELPDCAPAACEFNIPWEAEYLHNCSTAVTGGQCLVACAEGWFGGAEVWHCQATGDLTGIYPTCRTRTSTTTWTSTRTELAVLEVTGSYEVLWSNVSQAWAEAVVEESLLEYLNASDWQLSVSVTINASEAEANVFFELQIRTVNVTWALDRLRQVLALRDHAWIIQAALGMTVLRFGAEVADDLISFQVSSNAAGPGDGIEEPEEVVLAVVPAVGIGLLLVGCVGAMCCCLQRRRRLRKRGQYRPSAEPATPTAVVPTGGHELALADVDEEVYLPLELEDEPGSKPKEEEKQKLSAEERRTLQELGISLEDSESEPGESSLDEEELAVLGIGLEDELEELGLGFESEGSRPSSRAAYDAAGIFFEDESRSSRSSSEMLFESEENQSIHISVLPNDTSSAVARRGP